MDTCVRLHKFDAHKPLCLIGRRVLEGQVAKIGNHLEAVPRREGGLNGVGSDVVESESEGRFEGAVDRGGPCLVHHVACQPQDVAFFPRAP